MMCCDDAILVCPDLLEASVGVAGPPSGGESLERRRRAAAAGVGRVEDVQAVLANDAFVRLHHCGPVLSERSPHRFAANASKAVIARVPMWPAMPTNMIVRFSETPHASQSR